jgi:magnesium chelatase family protein
LLDRIDIHCEVPLAGFRELSSNTNTGESSEAIRQRVVAARGIQLERFKKSTNSTNSSMGSRQVRQHCQLSAEGNGYPEHAMEEMNFSARAHDRILKVARTLADLAGSMEIRPNDILEAIQFRSLDRKLSAEDQWRGLFRSIPSVRVPSFFPLCSDRATMRTRVAGECRHFDRNTGCICR